MCSLAGIQMLIQTGTVKAGKSVRITREMRRNPVKDHTDPLLMHIVHKIHKILRRAVSGSRRIIPGHLISPRAVKRMLHHRQQLNVRIAHFFYVICDHRSQFPVIIKNPAVIRFAE